jgi:perosamine synthetase
VTPRTRAVVAVDFAGQACDYDALRDVVHRHQLALVADACHAVGGSYRGRPVGSLADLSTFSFHPVKHITTGEGGMISTDDAELASRMRIFRNHGITTDSRQREEQGSWFYEMVGLGYNYRMTDFQCALGVSQLSKLPAWIARRREIAAAYDRAFADVPEVRPLRVRPEVGHAYHLYVVQLQFDRLKVDRARVFAALRAENIGVNVHYIPVHLHPFYRRHFGTGPGDCPVAENAYDRLLTVPLFPAMTDHDVADVVTALGKVIEAYRK